MAYKIPIKKTKEETDSNLFKMKNKKESEKKLFLEEIKNRGTITEKELLLVKRRLNDGTYSNDDVDLLYDIELEITPEQSEKGIKWLKNKAFKINGETRSNSPFGTMEEDKIRTFEKFEFAGFNDIGNYGFKNYVPVYRVVSKEGTFDYYVQGGDVKIIG